jgi:hypothetical protein
MPPCVDGERSPHGESSRHFIEALGRHACVGPGMRRQDDRFPAGFWKVLREPQRALDSTAHVERREMKSDHEHPLHHERTQDAVQHAT